MPSYKLRTLLIVLAMWLYGLAIGLILLIGVVFAVVSLDENILGIVGWLLEVAAIRYGIPLAIILALCGAIAHSSATLSNPSPDFARGQKTIRFRLSKLLIVLALGTALLVGIALAIFLRWARVSGPIDVDFQQAVDKNPPPWEENSFEAKLTQGESHEYHLMSDEEKREYRRQKGF